MEFTNNKILISEFDGLSGVYVILNLVSKKAYVGETTDFNVRIRKHVMGIKNGEGTNVNLCKEDNKTYLIFNLINHTYDKNNDETRSWIIDETICMYLLRKNGFDLYNGNDEKDNMGKERSFLLGEKDVEDFPKMKERLIEFLEKESKDSLYNQFENWNDYIECAEKELSEYLNRTLKIVKKESNKRALDKLNEMHKDKRIKLWEKLISRNSKDMYYIDLEKDSDTVYLKLLNMKLNKPMLSEIKMSQKSIIDMANKGELDRFIISDFGHYVEQTPLTILRSKMFDIENNKFDDSNKLMISERNKDNDKQGICLWSLKKMDIEFVREFLGKNIHNQESKYVIMPYTPSMAYAKDPWGSDINSAKLLNPFEDETIEKFFKRLQDYIIDENTITQKYAFGYAINKKDTKNKTGKKYRFPKSMFPPIVAKKSKKGRDSSSIAFLISELSFSEENFRKDSFVKHLEYYHGKTHEPCHLNKSQNWNRCVCLNNKDTFINEFSQEVTIDDYAGCIIAKLEYPYIVAVVNDEP